MAKRSLTPFVPSQFIFNSNVTAKWSTISQSVISLSLRVCADSFIGYCMCGLPTLEQIDIFAQSLKLAMATSTMPDILRSINNSVFCSLLLEWMRRPFQLHNYCTYIRSIDTSLLILQQLIYDFPHINRRRSLHARPFHMNKTLTHCRNRSFIVQWIFIGHLDLDIGHMRLFILRTIDLNCPPILLRCIRNDDHHVGTNPLLFVPFEFTSNKIAHFCDALHFHSAMAPLHQWSYSDHRLADSTIWRPVV